MVAVFLVLFGCLLLNTSCFSLLTIQGGLGQGIGAETLRARDLGLGGDSGIAAAAQSDGELFSLFTVNLLLESHGKLFLCAPGAVVQLWRLQQMERLSPSLQALL